MKQTMCLLVSVLLVGGVLAEEPEKIEALDILKKADAATKDVKLVRYYAVHEVTGWLTSRMVSGQGTAVIGGKCTRRPKQYCYDVKFQLPDSEATRTVTVGSDGKLYWLIDPSEELVYSAENERVAGSDAIDARTIAMTEFCHPNPFQDEINGDKAELKGTTKIGDEECYEIHVVYANSQGEATWFFSKNDFLPRRVDRFITGPSGDKGVSKLTLTNLVVDPKSPEDPFKLVVPEGYGKSDKFMPMRRSR